MGAEIIGPYKILEEIDSGGMAHVYRAEDSLGRFGIVALKVMRDEIALGREYQIRFRREAKIWSELDHANIVPVVDFSVDPDQAYVAMRFIDGCSLHDLLADRGNLPIDYALPLMKDILRAVDFAHGKQVIHRDIKPDNVMLDRNGKAYLTDFGIAKSLGATELTNTGARLGTPTYMSPEQIRGKKEITTRADIYSMGVMFYEMLTGHPPFENKDPIALSHSHAYEEPPPMKRRGAPIPAFLQELVMKMLEKEPRKRPRTAGSILRQIERFEKQRRKKAASSAISAEEMAGAIERKSRKRAETSLVVVEKRIDPLEAPRFPVAAIARVTALIVTVACLLGFRVPANLLASAADAVRAIHRSYQRLLGGQAAAEGLRYLDSGNPRLAILAFEKSIIGNPAAADKISEICFSRARAAFEERAYRMAELLASYCSRLRPRDIETRVLLARILLAQNRGREAGLEYVKALGWVSNQSLIEHFRKYGDLATALPSRMRRLVASRYYLAARGFVVSGHDKSARPYLQVALCLTPANSAYKRLFSALPPPGVR